ncbi:MAG: acyl carrier protein [Planctomycetaceae bacterium]|jgi:acyl carrier protein|nr:acyl carrier protein [Planctomycetaceae bacterium]
MASTQDKVVDIVAEQLGVDKEKITRESNFINDLGADSLDLVEMVMEFESQFGIRIPEDQTDKIQTVGEAIEAIEKAIAA